MPLAITVEPPSEVMLPPTVALYACIFEGGVRKTVGTTADELVVKVLSTP